MEMETPETKIPKETKTYELIDKSGKVTATFKGKQPRQAALKAATRGAVDIFLRERGSGNENKITEIHQFKGSVKQQKYPLPYPTEGPRVFITKRIEQINGGKKIPAELNVKGKDADLEKAGFKPYIYDVGVVQKVKQHNIPKETPGTTIDEKVANFIKGLK